MDQQSPVPDAAIERRKIGIGINMTILYSVIYCGFVVLSILRPQWMGLRAVFGLNLAVAYGLGLIIAAVILALVYNQMCKKPSPESGP